MKRWMMRRLGRTPQGAMDCHDDCHEVGDLLQHYPDGHLDAERASHIEAHLEACRRCGLEADTYEWIRSARVQHRPYVPPESLDRLREFGRRLARGEDPTPERHGP